MDFLQDALANGRKLRMLSIADTYTREMLAIEVDTSLPALRVVRVLEKLRLNARAASTHRHRLRTNTGKESRREETIP